VCRSIIASLAGSLLVLTAAPAAEARAVRVGKATTVAVTERGDALIASDARDAVLVRRVDARGRRHGSVRLAMPRAGRLSGRGSSQRSSSAAAAIGPEGTRHLALTLEHRTDRWRTRIAAARWRPGDRRARLHWVSPAGIATVDEPAIAASAAGVVLGTSTFRPHRSAFAVRRTAQGPWRWRSYRNGSTGELISPDVGWTPDGRTLAVWPGKRSANAAWGTHRRRVVTFPDGRHHPYGQQVVAGDDGTAFVGWLDSNRHLARLAWVPERGRRHSIVVGHGVSGWAGFASVATRGGRFVMAWTGRNDRLTVRMGDTDCQGPSSSPHGRPSVLPGGGHDRSPLMAIGSPRCGVAASVAEPSPKGEAQRCWPRAGQVKGVTPWPVVAWVRR